MSLARDGVWKGGVWASTVWAQDVWFETAAVSAGGGTSRRKLKRRLKRRLPEHELELDPIAAMALPAVAPGPMLDEQDDEDEELKLIIALRSLH